jgi:hypothetical protein
MPWSFTEDGFFTWSPEPVGLPEINAPEPYGLFEYLGFPAPDAEQEASAQQAIAITTLLAYNRTRGQGFTGSSELTVV